MFRKLLDFAEAGDNIGALLRGIDRETKSSVVRFSAKPGSIHPHTKFEGQVYVLTERRRRPSYSFLLTTTDLSSIFRTTDVTGVITLPEGTGNVYARR